MRLISQYEVQLSEADLKAAIYRHLKENSLDLDLPVDTDLLSIASNIAVAPHISVKWTRCSGDEK